MPPITSVPRTHEGLVAYFISHGCFDVVPATLVVGNESFVACRYKQRVQIGPGCRAYDRVEREHVDETLHVVGPQPKPFRVRRKTVLTFEGDERDWFVASWEPVGQQPYFLLSPWDVPGTSIDDHDPHLFTRVSAQLLVPVPSP